MPFKDSRHVFKAAKEQARELRLTGLSLGEIRNRLIKFSASAIHVWVRDLPVPDKHKPKPGLTQKQRRQHYREWSDSLKSDKPCKDCGSIYPPSIMHWDHLEGSVKVKDVCRMVIECCNKETILNEIAKCELVCSNCHGLRTIKRKEAAHASRKKAVRPSRVLRSDDGM
jgi:hypothetical protein